MSTNVETWHHAVTFNRRYGWDDELLAAELLIEWGTARGLEAVRPFDLPAIESGDEGRANPFTVARIDDYGRWCGYAMAFTVTDEAVKESDDAWRIVGSVSRLVLPGKCKGQRLAGFEEEYVGA